MYRHVLTAFARYFAALKSDECKTHVVHVGGNSTTVINATRSNSFGKQSRQNLRKKPKHTAILLLRKLLPFLFSIYTAVYIGHTLQYSVCQ